MDPDADAGPPDPMESVVAELDEALDAADAEEDPGDREEALGEVLARAERAGRKARKAGDRWAEATLAYLAGCALVRLGEPRSAVERLDAAVALEGPSPDLLLERAQAHLDLFELDRARDDWEAAARELPDEAAAEHGLGIVAELRGEAKEAERRFRRARRLAPERYPEPVRLTHSELEHAVEQAMVELPQPVRRWLSNVAVAVEDLPSKDDLAGEPPLPPTLLGLFRGAPLGDKASMDPWSHFPSSIALYQKNLERVAGSREELLAEIRTTLLHEVGHFLGLDEDDLFERGLD